MTQERPPGSLKQKISLAFFLVVLMTIGVSVIAIILSQGLKFRVDNLVNHDINQITTALKLARDSQKLQTITSRLDKHNDDGQRLRLIGALAGQWQRLIAASRSLAKLESDPLRQRQLNEQIDRQLHFSQQLELLDHLTDKALQARLQAVNIQTNLGILQRGFARELTRGLGELDDKSRLLIERNDLKALAANLEAHQRLAQYLHLGEQLFSLLTRVSNDLTIPGINEIQRDAMRVYISMSQMSPATEEQRRLISDWLSQIRQTMIGDDNIFSLTRDATKSRAIAGTHLGYQAQAAELLADYSRRQVTRLEADIGRSAHQLKFDSNAFLLLIIGAGILYSLFIWLTNWHYISKGIIKPVIATSQAINAIANEKLDTQLPKTDNLELQQMVSSLETLKSYAAQVKAISEIDGLTGAYNRRFFDLHLKLQLNKVHEYYHPLSILLFDIDNFKQYNDKYGHIAGDKCLKQVVEAATTLIHRPGDIIARYGGDEFVILLPNTALDDAVTIAEKIRLEVVSLAIPHFDSDFKGLATISLGVSCCLPGQQIGADKLIHQADEALYRAKLAGRNCCRSRAA